MLPKCFRIYERKDVSFGGGPTNFNKVARCYLKRDSEQAATTRAACRFSLFAC